jgi:hypothetical protein
MKALNVMPVEFSTYAYHNLDKFHFCGEEMMSHMTASRTLTRCRNCALCRFGLRARAVLSPLMAIQGMVTRTGRNGETRGAK